MLKSRIGRQIRMAVFTLTALHFVNALAIETAQVLPKNVNFASVRFGIMDGMGELFDPSGGISFRGDPLSRDFSLQRIKKYANPEQKERLNKLAQTLNSFGGAKNLADQLNLGTLQFDVDPSIKYYAPVFARGLTENFTLGIAVPIIDFKLDVGVKQVGSNVPQVKKEMQPLIDQSPELKSGFDELETSLVSRLNQVVSDRGYRSIHSREDTMMGDTQIVGLYQALRADKDSLIIKSALILPTGHEDDPDDLTDLNNQHQLALGLGFLNDYKIAGRWVWGAGVYYLARLPDRATIRVPADSEDSLPGPERKENLSRDLGDSVSASSNLRYQFNDYFMGAVAYETGTKNPDRYAGGNPWDYSLLAKKTYQGWSKATLAVEYSTVTSFMGGVESVPFSISYDYSDIFWGINIERQQVHELGLKLYF